MDHLGTRGTPVWRPGAGELDVCGPSFVPTAVLEPPAGGGLGTESQRWDGGVIGGVSVPDTFRGCLAQAAQGDTVQTRRNGVRAGPGGLVPSMTSWGHESRPRTPPRPTLPGQLGRAGVGS